MTVCSREIDHHVERSDQLVGKHSGGVKMLEMSTIEWMARQRREEIDRELLELSMKRRGTKDASCSNDSHLDLNIRLVLQPRLSLSIWFGRGVR